MGKRCEIWLAVFCAAIAFAIAMPMAAIADEGSGNGSGDNKYYYGNVVNAGLDKGYSEANAIKQDDPNFGWKLGEFVVSGFTSRKGEDTPIFLKNVGDQVELSFNLHQNIDALNGNAEVKIAGDGNGFDEYFGIPKSDFGRGTLIVRHTDYQNASKEPQVYTDYLPALEVGADTHIDLFEEGDYEVALDYEIQSPGLVPFLPAYNNYRIYFKYKVRNSNTMLFLFDTKTKDELFNGSVTANGFRIDMSESHYLDVSVKKEVLNNTGDGLVEDTRFNRSATDGAVFEEEGIYTITVKNPTTSEEATTKRIYVGSNDVLKASVANSMPVDEVAARIEQGATVAEDGSLELAEVKMDTSQAREETVNSVSKISDVQTTGLNFGNLSDPTLQRYVADAVYSDLVDKINTDKYYVENVEVTYVSKEYLDELAYNSLANIYFGYTLAELEDAFQGQKYIFTLGDDGKTAVKAFEGYDDTYDQVIRNVATGGGVILVCVTISAVTGGAGVPAASAIFAASAKTGAIAALSSGVISGGAAAIFRGLETGDMDTAIKTGALTGSEGFMWGALGGALAGGAGEAMALRGATANGLTMNQVAAIQKESKYPLDVIKQFNKMEQYEICKNAGLTSKMVDGETALIRDIDLAFVDKETGLTNLQRMEKGLAALDPATGEAYELHHIGQKVDSTLAILTQEEHRLGGNSKIWHLLKDSDVHKPGNTFDKTRQEFWKSFAKLLTEVGA